MLASYTPFYRAVIAALQKPVNRGIDPIMAYLIGTSSTSSPSVKIYNTDNYSRVTMGAMGPTLGPTIEYVSAFSPDGTKYVVGHNLFGGTGYTVFETTGWTVIAGTPIVGFACTGCFISPNSRYLALTFSTSPRLRVIDMDTWTVVAPTPTIAASTNHGQFSPDGSKLVLAHSNVSSKNFTAIDTATWTVITTPTSVGTGRSVSFTPDGTKVMIGVAATGNITYLNIYDTTTWTLQPVPSISLDTAGGVEVANYDPTGNRIDLYATDVLPFGRDKLLTFNSVDNTQRYDTPALKRFITRPPACRDNIVFYMTEQSILAYDYNTNNCLAEIMPPAGATSFRHVCVSENMFDITNATQTEPQVSILPSNHVHDPVTNNRIMTAPSLVASSPHTSPLAAYSTWANTMGVSDVTSLPHNLTLSDWANGSATTLTLNFPYGHQGASNIIIVGGNGTVGLIHNHTDTDVFGDWTSTGAAIIDAYGDVRVQQDDILNYVPDNMWKGLPSALLAIGNHHLQYSVTTFKWNQNVDSVIIYMEYTDVNTTHNIQVAYRFMQTGHMDVVFISSTFPRVKFTLTTYNELDWNLYYPIKNFGSFTHDVMNVLTHYKNHNQG